MDESGDKHMEESPKSWDKHMKECFEWILMVSVSPIAFLIFMLMALYSLLRFLCKVALLFIIVAINTPFAVMYNVSLIMFKYNFARLRESSRDYWNWSDPRANVGIEVKLFVSDFLKVVAGELLLLLSTGIITFFTAPLLVFYISTVVWVVAIVHKWLNSDCLSKTVLSCLCDAYGLSPMMFLFSFIGFFDIGCHPIAKCSFLASEAFLFVKDGRNQFSKEDAYNQLHTITVNPIVDEIRNSQIDYERMIVDPIVQEIKASQIDYEITIVNPIVHEIRISQIDYSRNSNHELDLINKCPKVSDVEEGHSKLNKEDIEEEGNDEEGNDDPKIEWCSEILFMAPYQEPIKMSKEDWDEGDKKCYRDFYPFDEAVINPKQVI